MVKSGCVKIDLDNSKYSSPVPVIGLYIAVASLVCFLAILYDIVSGFRHRKRWLPCRLFSLNSVTLSLLAIAAKLPVDLTTQIPSAQDQLSKLTGTTMICTSMAFLLPSLGANEHSECLTNMAALSIFVVTVVINICIQIYTGVVFMFVAEHIIIMWCMLFLLLVLWVSAVNINHHKDIVLNFNKDLLNRCSQGSMFHWLKLAYMFGHNNNPQFLLGKFETHRLASWFCILCFVVVIQAASRSLSLKFCPGVSDYGWSVWIIVVTQILAISLASCAIIFRSFTLLLSQRPFGTVGSRKYRVLVNFEIIINPLLKNTLRDRYFLVTFMVMAFMMLLSATILIFLDSMLDSLCLKYLKPRYYYENNGDENNGDIQEYTNLVHCSDRWSLDKSVKFMKRWMEVSRSTHKPLSHLSQLLSKILPSTRPMHSMEIKDQLHPDQPGIQVSSLSLVLLVRIAQVSLPSKLSESLVQAYNESHEIIHFISRTKAVTFENKAISKLAQAVWRGPDFSILLPVICKALTTSETHQIQSDFDRALAIIKSMLTAIPSDIVRETIGVIPGMIKYIFSASSSDTVWEALIFISAFISRREYSSVDDLYNYIEQLFVDMVHILFAQLPQAIFKDVVESPVEKIDKRARHALQILCRITPLEDHIQWSFPDDCNISSLITSPVHEQMMCNPSFRGT